VFEEPFPVIEETDSDAAFTIDEVEEVINEDPNQMTLGLI